MIGFMIDDEKYKKIVIKSIISESINYKCVLGYITEAKSGWKINFLKLYFIF
uniref:Uncharacterized protein n=1 Tax=Anguilla anguilla TaxID=7936 RepID=A0A0E9XSH3_ANGAN